MTNDPDTTLDVIYNDTCPICSREVSVYQSKTREDVVYHGLSEADLATFGLDADQAAREFHVMHRGKLYSGVAAFALLWDRMPGTRWLASFVRLPGIRSVANGVYRHLLAPMLFAMHKRRQVQSMSRGGGDV